LKRFTLLSFYILALSHYLIDVSHASDSASDRQLAYSQQWLNLLHYKPTFFGNNYTSQIEDRRFFLTDDGHNNPELELAATIDAINQNQKNLMCRFPARIKWIHAQKRVHASALDNLTCPELDSWLKTINPASLTLVFPAAYLNSPSSMFGHTLLRINPGDNRKNLSLVSYALNYAANVSEVDNNFFFAFNGIFGGYPGALSIVPYYEKITEYSDIENRDIWEYELNLDKQEITQLMLHAWELKTTRTPYYFFTQNCSYLLLTLLEVARAGIDLTSPFQIKAIPSDTVRAIVDANLVKDIKFRPSSATIIEQRLLTLNKEQRTLVNAMVNNRTKLDQLKLNRLSKKSQAQVIEITYDILRYRAFATPSIRDQHAQYTFDLLAARSTINENNVWPDIDAPEHRAEKGHKSSRLAIGIGEHEGNKQLFLKFRPAYHDILDPPQSYQFGAQINFLDINLTYSENEDRINLSQLTFIDIVSLSPRNDTFQPISWKVNFGFEKKALKTRRADVLQVTPGFGVAHKASQNSMLSAFLDSRLEIGRKLENKHSAGIGPTLGYLLNTERLSAQFQLNAMRFFAGETFTHYRASAELAFHINTHASFRINIAREATFDRYTSQHTALINWYF